MLAAMATRQDAEDPLSCLELTEVPEPEPRPGWTKVRVRAAALNPHDLWSLRGVGMPVERLPIILGCDAAGVDERGHEVVVHPILGDKVAGGGDETLDPGRALLSEDNDGAFAEYLLVPERNVLPKPANLSFEEAACLPVAWGTAFRMLFTKAEVKPGDRILVQGAAGGVASAAITLASAAGATVYATSRSEHKRRLAVEMGAREVFPSGARLPERVDVVIETVGAATWEHSLKALRPGGAVVVAGATTGANPPANLARVFFLQQRILGCTGATREEFAALLRFVESAGIRPRIDRVIGLEEIHTGFKAMADGDITGKVVVRIG